LGVNRLFDYIKQEPKDWKELINKTDNSDEMKGIREKTRTGRPFGTNDFIERLERQLKRLWIILWRVIIVLKPDPVYFINKMLCISQSPGALCN